MTFLCRDSAAKHSSPLRPPRRLARSLLRPHSCLLLLLTCTLTLSRSAAVPVKVPKQIPFLHLVMCRPRREGREQRRLLIRSGPSRASPHTPAPSTEEAVLSHDGDGNADITPSSALNWDSVVRNHFVSGHSRGHVRGGGASFFFLRNIRTGCEQHISPPPTPTNGRGPVYFEAAFPGT